MCKIAKLLAVFLLGSQSLFSWQECCRDPTWPASFNFELGAGYRQDSLNWKIVVPAPSNSCSGSSSSGFSSSSSDEHPLFKSVLDWDNLRIAQVGGSASYVSCRNYAIKVWGDYGNIYHGNVTDTDYIFDGCRDIPFSKSKADAGKGHVFDVSGAVGYRWTGTGGRCIFTPYIGYSHHEQHLHLFNGEQLLVLSPLVEVDLGPISGLNSTYKTHWYGPWIGAEFDVRVECNANLFGAVEWHYARYKATGNWNLRRDFAGPFQHSAYGHGFIARLGISWDFCPRWSIAAVGDYKRFTTGDGSDHTRIRTEEGVILQTKSDLRPVRWHSFSAMGMLAYRF